MESNNDAQDIYTAYLSDTALKIIDWQECDMARDYLDLAIKDYQSGRWDNSNQDYFDEPLRMAACYLSKLEYKDKNVLDNLNKSNNALLMAAVSSVIPSPLAPKSLMDATSSNFFCMVLSTLGLPVTTS